MVCLRKETHRGRLITDSMHAAHAANYKILRALIKACQFYSIPGTQAASYDICCPCINNVTESRDISVPTGTKRTSTERSAVLV